MNIECLTEAIKLKTICVLKKCLSKGNAEWVACKVNYNGSIFMAQICDECKTNCCDNFQFFKK